MDRRNQRGEARLSTLFWLLVLAAMGYAGWHVIPAYFANYSLADKMNEIARTPKGTTPDPQVLELLMREVRERDLMDYIGPGNFRITTLDHSRKISCEYEREIQILPGWKRVVQFSNHVDQPLIF